MVFFVVAVRLLVTYVYVRSLRGARYALNCSHLYVYDKKIERYIVA